MTHGRWTTKDGNQGFGVTVADEEDGLTEAVAATRAVWEPPPLGMITFVDRDKTRRKRDPGRCYRKAGFIEVGETAGGLVALQLLPEQMPQATPAIAPQLELIA